MGLKFSSFTYSSIDVPNKFSLVLFLPYCNFRCKHCINWKLVENLESENLEENKIIEEIKGNPVIECLVISGGEPSVYKAEEIKDFVQKVKEINPNIKVRIDTNGYNPKFVERLRDSVDGFAIDVKSPFKKELYEYTTSTKVNIERIKESLNIADGMELTIFRTVKYPWLNEENLNEIKEFTKELKSPHFFNEFYEVPDCPF